MPGFNPDFQTCDCTSFSESSHMLTALLRTCKCILPDRLGTADCYTTNTTLANLQNLRYAISLLTPLLDWSASAAQENVFVAARLVTGCLQDLRCQCVSETSWYPESSHADVHFDDGPLPRCVCPLIVFRNSLPPPFYNVLS